MRIDGIGNSNVPIAPVAAPAAPAGNAQQSFAGNASAAALELQLEQQKGGGGGGGHHAVKKAVDPIDDIAARNSLNIEARKKTMLDRMDEIERMKAEMAAKDEQVGEKDPDADDGEQPKEENPSQEEQQT